MSERWDRHFLELAYQHAQMSKDPNTKTGAVIVNYARIVLSMGFNGFPRGIADTAERLDDRDMKLKLVVHAEMNAILAAARIGVSVFSGTMYHVATDNSGTRWGGPPCTRCTVEAIQAGIARVVSYPVRTVPSRWHDDLKLARGLLAEAGVKFIEVEP